MQVTLREWIRGLHFMRRRKQAYQIAFTSETGKQVLKDLAKFCRANETTWDTDPRLHATLEGRREVWLRIVKHLNLTDEQLMDLYSGFDRPQMEDGINV